MLSSAEQQEHQQRAHHERQHHHNGHGNNNQHPYYPFDNNTNQNHLPSTGQSQEPSALWLLKQPSVIFELQRMARRLVERQRHTDDPGVSPCLFVLLPKTSRGLFSASAGSNGATTTARTAAAPENNSIGSHNNGPSDEGDFWLYFLCDCDFMTPESPILGLHICSPSPVALSPHPSPSPSSLPLQYHNTDNHRAFPPPAITYPGGYQLRNPEEFVEEHALPMLSLLFQVEQANEDLTSADRIWGGIRYLAERCREDLFAVYQPDNESDSQQKGASSGHGGDYDGLDGYQDEGEEDDQGEEGDEEAESRWMRLQEEDFEDPYRVAGKISGGDHYGSGINGINFQALDLNRDHHHNDQQDHITSTEQPATEGEGSLVLGADVLCQVNFPYIDGGILWLCAAHNEMLCNSMAAAKLRDFIKSKGGNCIPMEKSAEIQFHAREDARVFYGMLDEYKCVIKLKIGFEWEGGVTEEDLWELCQTVHSSTVRDLTIDCGGTGFGGANGGRLTFRPMLGMMCRLGFTALTVENFDGMFISPEEPLCTQGVSSRRSSRSNSSSNFYNNSDINTHQFDASSSSSGDAQFSLQDFRNATTILALPDNIQVQKLAFRHWARVPDRTAIVNLIKVLPNLTDLETMTDDIELLYESIQIELYLQARTAVEFRTSHSSGSYHHPLSHLNLLSVGHYGSKVELTLSKSSNPDVANRILNARWKTNKAPDSRLLQSVIGLETLEFTQCVRLWEHALALQRIVGCNYSTLQKVEIVCSTDKMADAWVFLKTEFQEPTMFSSPTAAALGRGGGYFGRDSSLSSVGSHPGRRISGRSDDSSQQRHHHQQRNRRPVHLRVYDRVGHSLESSNIEQDNQTILHLDQYDNASSPSSFRSQLELQCQIATRLRISQQFTNASQLDRLSQDITMIRAQAQQRFCLYEFVIYLTRTLAESAGFLEAAWKLMCQLPKALTIQIDGSFDRRLGATGGAQSAEDPSPRPHDIPGLLLDEFARLQRVGLDQNWNSWFELWMQEQLAQRALPILEYVPLQSGGFVFYAAESHQWSNASETGLEDGGLSAKVVYSLTHYR